MLVDGFMFYNELDVLELRLQVLDPWVDRFVLVESEVNHKGEPKPLFFKENKERFANWLPKIKYVLMTAEEAPKDRDPWSREKYQRNCILRGMEDLPGDTAVMISDVDEIPDLSKISFSNWDKKSKVFHMYMFEYSFDYMFTGEPWFGTTLTTLEDLRTHGPNLYRSSRWSLGVIPWAGWHLSSFGNGAHVANKLSTYAHSLDPRELECKPSVFQDLIDKGLHLDGTTKLLPRPPEVPLPEPFLKYLENLKTKL